MLAATFLSGPAGLVHAMPTLSASGQSTPVVRDHRGEAQQPRPPGPVAEPALAPEQRDPAARLQVVIKNIIIHDDRDWGEGDINIKVQIGRSQGALLVESTLPEFGANSGDTKLVNRIVPAAGDVMADASIGSAIGFPVYAGETYQLAISGVDKDPIFDDQLGVLMVDINEQKGWGIGSRTERGTVGLGWTWGVFYGEGPGFGRGPAYFSVEYEIRRVPLPDFEPRIILRDTGDGQFYCVEVRNVGERPSGLFQVAVRTDGTLLRAPTLPALAVSATTEHCVLRSELPAGEHLLSFRVDEARQIPEMNESNNLYEWRIPARSTASGLAPGSTPTGTSTPVLSGASTPTPANSPTTVTRTPTATPRPTSTSSQR